MELIKTKGIVISQTPFRENDRLLTVFTDDRGTINVSAKGAVSRHNNLKAATRVFCYSSFVLYDKKSSYYTIAEASPIESFVGLSKDIERLEAATAMLKFIKHTAVENVESNDALRLLLNSLYMLSETDKNAELIKCIFYIKNLVFMGLPPVTGECAVCGAKNKLTAFFPKAGGVICSDCAAGEKDSIGLSHYAERLMHYIIFAPYEKLFGISAEENLYAETLKMIGLFISEHLGFNI